MIVFDPKMQPGYSQRLFSLDSLVGPGKIDQTFTPLNKDLMDKRDLRKVFKTFTDPRMLPSFYNKVK